MRMAMRRMGRRADDPETAGGHLRASSGEADADTRAGLLQLVRLLARQAAREAWGSADHPNEDIGDAHEE